MVTVGISKWATEFGHEMGKRSLEMKPLPDFVQMIGPYFYPGEAAEAIANVYMVFFGVPGFRYSTKLASGTAATMKMMGLE